jgi:transcriptional regulator with GAF, ATPase, and Fis domain
MADAVQVRADLMQRYLAVMPRTGEEQVLRLIIEMGARAVGADEGSLLIFDPKTDELVFIMTYGSSEEVLIGQRLPVGKGITGLAAASREVQIGAPIYKDIKQTEAIGTIQAVIAAPMVLGDDLIGVITAVSTKPDKRFTMADGQLYASLATVAAVVVHQLQRIRALEGGTEPNREPAALAADPAQQEVMDRISRLLQRDPQVVRQVATMLGAIEAMTPGGAAR